MGSPVGALLKQLLSPQIYYKKCCSCKRQSSLCLLSGNAWLLSDPFLRRHRAEKQLLELSWDWDRNGCVISRIWHFAALLPTFSLPHSPFFNILWAVGNAIHILSLTCQLLLAPCAVINLWIYHHSHTHKVYLIKAMDKNI